MRLSHLVGKRTKEKPRDAELTSHQLLLRGGYIKQLASGIFTLLPIGKRIAKKIEKIIRDEMDALDGQESTMPVVMPATIWQESGRYDQVDSTMVRFDDRTGAPCVLGMTHEEAVVHMIRDDITSYKQLPAMVYQIQTKFRDEPRSRGGLIRVREFTMKDAYSFHASQDCLVDYYQRCFQSYEKIYRRCGLSGVISVESDSGMMGGKVAHEFMYVNPCGEDSLIIGDKSGYRANKEVATTRFEYKEEEFLPLEVVPTPGQATIEEVASFLGVEETKTCKIVLLENLQDSKLVCVLLRGDRELNEIAVRKALNGAEIRFAEDELILSLGIVPGYGSMAGVEISEVHLLVDESIVGNSNLVAGANKEGYHFRNWNFGRDLEEGTIGQFSFVQEGDLDPLGDGAVSVTRGVEVGNIFQLGSRYSETMGATYLDENGKQQPFIMGCYGIGVGRLLACLIEEHHDDYGPIWPMSVAPFELHLCMLDKKKEDIERVTLGLYEEFRAAKVDVLIDDRDEKAGFQFADADLIGAPLRVVVSKKTLSENMCELTERGKRDKELIPLTQIVPTVRTRIEQMLSKFSD
ncbi:proline--tRNA ligase [bacterium]|jgi:prolyl-tRNA synthetase|nr:proline--tRNA ligase [bacterium]